jgi:hypothetical protein
VNKIKESNKIQKNKKISCAEEMQRNEKAYETVHMMQKVDVNSESELRAEY